MSQSARPVFIVGSPRSGTSILTWCLGQHPNLLPLAETYWLGRLAVQLDPIFQDGAARGARSQLSSAGVTRDAFYRFFGEACDSLILRYERRPEAVPLPSATDAPNGRLAFRRMRHPAEPKRRWVDGTPENSLFIAGLLRLFPHARFIHLLRDVRSVVKSLMNLGKLDGATSMTEAEAYETWLRRVRACVQAERAYGSDVVLRVGYADLLAAPRDVMGRCLTFLGEAFSEQCLELLATRINSSNVAADFDPYDPATAPELRSEADDLSDKLLAEAACECRPDRARAAEIEAEFESFVGRSAALAADYLRALDVRRSVTEEILKTEAAVDRAKREIAFLREWLDTRGHNACAIEPAR